ncbi:hypothetical protein KIF53_21660 [Chromobacterium subtsugae]|uniref:Uncharacterized protein n=1 Tax=Chromobacterium subtsugae TaxID=251747 RepID=A0ABS7FJJ6_9NEIS|nr:MULTISPECIES: hypothetical protein [Chromobacterium]MBW7569161.1 hypothetical protein [Chromobacterium subtsugae]MBW8290250.1 hypothetical protein [Chromobacterium subtsugae]
MLERASCCLELGKLGLKLGNFLFYPVRLFLLTFLRALGPALAAILQLLFQLLYLLLQLAIEA